VGITVGALLGEARARLRAAGVDDPAREAAWLWEGVTRAPSGAAYLAREREADADEAARFAGAVERRAGGEPLAYVIGWTAFRRRTVATDRRALIPRPETEGLVELVLARRPTGRVADVCTGTGCVALALADEGRYDEVYAVELDPAAHALAAENITAAGLPVRLLAGDLVAPLRGLRLDVVVANPPYVSEPEYAALDPAVAAWEPRAALASGASGLDHTRRLLDEAREVLAPGGLIALELDATRGAASAALAATYGWTDIAVHHDLYGRDRFLTARRGEE
jgi:release factor glutamine methyltransferase